MLDLAALAASFVALSAYGLVASGRYSVAVFDIANIICGPIIVAAAVTHDALGAAVLPAAFTLIGAASRIRARRLRWNQPRST